MREKNSNSSGLSSTEMSNCTGFIDLNQSSYGTRAEVPKHRNDRRTNHERAKSEQQKPEQQNTESE